MKSLFNLMIALFVWLGVFELNLVKPLLTQPLRTVVGSLTFIDVILFVITLIVVIGVLTKFDQYTDARKEKSDAALGR